MMAKHGARLVYGATRDFSATADEVSSHFLYTYVAAFAHGS